jgi:2-oxoisovalerate dehydrogenase E1 component
VVLESKGLYRMPLGDAFPGEPTDPQEVAALKRAIGFGGHIPELPDDFRVPFSKAARRRAGGDLTIATWGRSTLFCLQAVQTLAERGIQCDLLDMRTVVPPDLDTLSESVDRTGRLLVVHEDRVFSSVGRELQGAIVERFGERHVVTRVLGQDPVPGMPQNVHLEERLAMNPDKIVEAAQQVMALRAGSATTTTTAPAAAARPSVLWTPNRHFVA